MEQYTVFIEITFMVIVGLIAFVVRGIKADLDQVKKESVGTDLCLKTHELDAAKIDNISALMVRVEAQTKADHKETRQALDDLAKVVDGLKVTLLKVGQLRRRSDRGE